MCSVCLSPAHLLLLLVRGEHGGQVGFVVSALGARLFKSKFLSLVPLLSVLLQAVSLVLGTSLQIAPANELPLITKQGGGKVIIVNLQVGWLVRAGGPVRGWNEGKGSGRAKRGG